MIRRMLMPLAFGLAGTLVLATLGTWQVQRLDWKLGILARMEERLVGPPAALPAAPSEAEHEYLRVAAEGRLLPGELHVFTSGGYRVIAPFETGDGRRILLDRGLVPPGEKDAARPDGPLAVEGALVWPQETDRFTAAPDREANVWFARDVALMAEALGTEPAMLVVERADGTAGAAPRPQPVTVAVRNPHLGYAATWFGLALVWAGMTVYWLWRIRRPPA